MALRKATVKDRLLLLISARRAYRVEGDSMLPTVKNGDTVLADPCADLLVGDIVVVDHPYVRSLKLIKRVESIQSNGRYVLAGDNPEASTDSRSFGSVSKNDIKGKVVCRTKV